MNRISVVIPAVNEAAELPATLQCAHAVPEIVQVILSDGGSQDGTPTLARELGCDLVEGPAGRGAQLRRGAELARGDVILLLHADTWLPPGAGRAISACLEPPSVAGGGFCKRFREAAWFTFGARARSWLCFRLFGILFGDQALFVRRSALDQIGGVPDWPLMEEFELCRRLRKVGRLRLAPETVTASARRFRKHGVLRTYATMARVLVRYRLGTSPEKLRRLYESS